MNVEISRRRCAFVLAGSGLATLAGGCSSMFARKPAEAEVTMANMVQTTPDPIRIVYRTRTDRLNLAGANLPHCSIAELRIDYPHPTIKSTICLASVRTTPCSVNATPFPQRGVTASVASMFDGDTAAGSAPPSAAWSSEIALWELEAIIASLEKLNFFRKHRTVLSADVFLSVETKQHAVGKKYRPVAELDAMVLRVVQQQGPSMQATGMSTNLAVRSAPRAELARLPSLE